MKSVVKTPSWLLFAFVAVLALPVRAAVASEEALLKIALDPQRGVVERTRAFTDLRAVAKADSIPALAALLADSTWSYAARSVLEPMPGREADEALLGALHTVDNAALRAGVIDSLGRRRCAGAVAAVAKLLGSSDAVLTEAALNALGDIATLAAADALAAFTPSAAHRVTWADALLRAADALGSSHRTQAFDLYRVVAASDIAPQALAAKIALARTSGQPVAALITALQSADATLRQAALAAIRGGEFGARLAADLFPIFATFPTDTQVQLLAVLQDRHDRAAAPLARAALPSADARVRTAAARLLSVVGDSSDALALVRLMTGREEPARSARLALARIPGEDTTALLLERFHAGADDRAAALEVLAARGHRPLVAELLQPELYADTAFGRLAANALLTLGTGADLGRVLDLYVTLPPERRPVIDPALRRIAAKHPSPGAAATALIAAAGKLPVAEAGMLFAIMGGLGGDESFAAILEMLKSSAPETRLMAVRTLGGWPDPLPGPTLLALARDDADVNIRAAAVQAATTLFRKNAANPDGTAAPERVPSAIQGLRQTWAVAAEPSAKSAIVATLRGLKDTRAVAAADELETKSASAK